MAKKKLNKELTLALLTLCYHGCTDSDIEDFCSENNLVQREVFKLIDIFTAPPCCKTCANVGLRPMYPCNDCSRPLTDRYQHDEDADKKLKEITAWLSDS